MKKNWPYRLQHLIDYVENKLSVEEDIELSNAIRKDEHLQIIVEGIELYQESETNLSLEEYLRQSKKELWKNLTPYLSGALPTLSESEKSFKHWVVEKKLHIHALIYILIYIVGIIVIRTNFQDDIYKSLKQWSYIFQVFVLMLTGFFFYKIRPKILLFAKHRRAVLGRLQMWELLVKLTSSWIVLYIMLLFLPVSDEFNYSILLLNSANNLTIVYIYLCYHSLNNDSIDLTTGQVAKNIAENIKAAINKPIQAKERRGWIFVLLALIIEMMLITTYSDGKDNFHLLFGIFSGLICMAFTARLVGRIGSKFLSKEELTIICLSLYAGIQPLLVFIFPEGSYQLFTGEYADLLQALLSISLVLYALFGKILLLTFVAWSLESNRIIKYLKKAKELEEKDEEKELLEIKEDMVFGQNDSIV